MTTYTWKVDADGDWADAADWSPSGPPTTGANVVIDTTKHHTITLNYDDGLVSVSSLAVGNDVFNLYGDTLSITSAASFGNELELSYFSFDDGIHEIFQAPTLNLNSVSSTTATLLFDSGTVEGSGTLTVSGRAIFENFSQADETVDDVQSGTGATLLLGATTIKGNVDLDGGRLWENKGTITWTDDAISLGDNPYGTTVGGGTIRNDAGAAIHMTGDGLVMRAISGSDNFINAGLLEQTNTSSAATNAILVALTDTGAGKVAVQTGTLLLNDGGSSSASAFSVASAAELEFNGIFTMSGGTYNVAGITYIAGGTTDFSASGIKSFGSELMINSQALLEMGAQGGSTPWLDQFGGDIDGSGTLTVSGVATITYYSAQTGSGTTLLEGATTLNGDFYLDGGRILKNRGTLDVTVGTNGANIYLGENGLGTSVGGATIENQQGATIDVEDGALFIAEEGKDGFLNAGLFEITQAAGDTTTVSVAFIDTGAGAISLQAGVLQLNDGGSSSASAFAMASGTELEFNGTFTMTGGTYDVAGITYIAGGTTNFSASAIKSFGSELMINAQSVLAMGAQSGSAASLDQFGGEISGTGRLTISGAATLEGGAEIGAGTTLLEATTTTSSDLYLDGGRVLENNSTFNVTSGEIFLGENGLGGPVGGATIENEQGATFDFEASSGIGAGKGTLAFVNAGLLEMTQDDSLTSLQVNFVNTGKVSAVTGGFAFEGGGASTAGTFTAAKGATLAFSDASFVFSSTAISGSGTLLLNGGTTVFNAGTTITMADWSVSGGGATVDEAISYAGVFNASSNSTLTLSGGALTLTGNASFSNATVNGADALDTEGATLVANVSLDGTATWNNSGTITQKGGQVTLGDLSGSNSVTLTNLSSGTYDLADGSGIDGGNSTASTFTNDGLFEKTAGGPSYIRASFIDTGTVTVTGTLVFDGPANSFAGAIDGAGKVVFGVGVTTLNAGTTVSVSSLSIAETTAQLTVAESLSFAGLFSLGSSSILDLGSGDALTLTGGASFVTATVDGAGALDTTAKTLVSGMTLGGTATWNNSGVLTLKGGALTIGDATRSAATFDNLANATFDIADSSFIQRGTSAASGFVNAGLFEKTGGVGVSTIAVSFGDTGTVSVTVAKETLEFLGPTNSFAGAIDGAGAVEFGAGVTTLNAGTTIGVASLSEISVTGSGTKLVVDAGVTDSGAFSEDGGSAIAIASGATLTLGGTASLAGKINGHGVLDFSGASLTIGSGAAFSVAGWSMSGSGATTLDTALIYGGAFSLGAGSTFGISTNFALTLTGPNSLSGSVDGGGELTLTGGATTIAGGAAISVADWTVWGAATKVTSNEALTFTGTFEESAKATITLAGGALTLTGADTFAGATIDGADGLDSEGATAVAKLTIGGTVAWNNSGTVTQNGGGVTLGDSSGAVATLVNLSNGIYDITDDSGFGGGGSAACGVSNAGLFEKTSDTGVSIVSVSFVDTGTVTAATGTLAFSGPTNSFTGAIAGAGEVEFAGGSTTLSAGTVVSVATLAEAGATTVLSLAESLDYAGDFLQGAGSTLAIASGDTLTLSGGANLQGTTSGAAALALTGGTTIFALGATLSLKTLSMSGKTTVAAVDDNLAFAGAFTEGAGSTLDIAGGDTLTLTGTATLAGKVDNLGTLDIGGGATTIEAHATLAESGLTVSGSHTLLTLGEFLTFAGVFADTTGARVALTGGGLALTGESNFAGGTVDGARELETKGSTSLSGLTLGGTVDWANSGMVTESLGALTLGDAKGATAVLSNSSTGTYDLDDDFGVDVDHATASYIANAGLFEKTGGAGVSLVAAGIVNTGRIVAQSGTLDLQGALSGAGNLQVFAGATLEVGGAVSTNQTLTFEGGGEIQLGDLDVGGNDIFQGAIAGFGAGDTFDTGAPFGTGTKFNFVENSEGTEGVLTLTDGSLHASIHFLGNYGKANFVPTGDLEGGTAFTFSA